MLNARCLASLIGKIIAMGLVLGHCNLQVHDYRSMYALLQTRSAWWSLLELSVGARIELQFWAESLHDFNAQPIWHNSRC